MLELCSLAVSWIQHGCDVPSLRLKNGNARDVSRKKCSCSKSQGVMAQAMLVCTQPVQTSVNLLHCLLGNEVRSSYLL